MNIPLVKFLKTLPKAKLQQVVLVAVGSLIALVMAFQFYVGKQISTIVDSKRQIEDLKHEIEDAEQASREAVKKEGERKQLVAFVDNQRSLMVSGDPFSWVVREISLLAEKHPVRIAGLHPGGISPHPRNPKFSIYTVSIDLDGGYDEIGTFIRDLENAYPTGEVRSVDVTNGSETGKDLHVSLRLALLVRPQPKSAGKQKTEA